MLFFKFPYTFRITSGKLHLLGTLVLPLIKNHDLTIMSDDRKEMCKMLLACRGKDNHIIPKWHAITVIRFLIP